MPYGFTDCTQLSRVSELEDVSIKRPQTVKQREKRKKKRNSIFKNSDSATKAVKC